MSSTQQREFHIVLIKPTHYDDDGYPIQWFRSAVPSNTLACLNGLAMDAQRTRILGPDVAIQIHTHDETNQRMRPDKIIRMISKRGGKALIALVGVQSNQFPRAVDISRPFLKAGLPVCIGGFHVSGCIAMLPEWRRTFAMRRRSAFRSLPARPKTAASIRLFATPGRASSLRFITI